MITTLQTLQAKEADVRLQMWAVRAKHYTGKMNAEYYAQIMLNIEQSLEIIREQRLAILN